MRKNKETRKRQGAIESELPAAAVHSPPSHRPSAADLRAAGNKLRDRVARKSQGLWKRPSDRADPLDIPRASDASRMAQLVSIRYGRMLQTPFTRAREQPGRISEDSGR